MLQPPQLGSLALAVDRDDRVPQIEQDLTHSALVEAGTANMEAVHESKERGIRLLDIWARPICVYWSQGSCTDASYVISIDNGLNHNDYHIYCYLI
jgi:hypothetical protein